MHNINYQIIGFYKDTGQIEVLYDGYHSPILIDLPIENGLYPEGESLELYIRGFIPSWVIERKEQLKSGIQNESYFENIVSDYKLTKAKTPEKGKFNVGDVYMKRQMLLKTSDWTQLPDSPLPDYLKKQWAKYRQELRDITNKPLDENMIWPKPPTMLGIISFNK